MNPLFILGTFITNKESARSFVTRLYSRFDGSMESSVAIGDIETQIVNAGFLSWDEVETAELASYTA